MMKYSPSTGGFYHESVHETFPDDVVDVTEEEHAALFEAQARGMEILCVDGRPQACLRRWTPLEAVRSPLELRIERLEQLLLGAQR